MDSGLELYSSKSPKRDELNNSNVFRLSEQHTDGYASNLAKLSKEAKFIVGTSKGHLSVYDYESANLTECSEILYAHSAEITGVSSHPSSTSELNKILVAFQITEHFFFQESGRLAPTTVSVCCGTSRRRKKHLPSYPTTNIA